MAQYQEHFGDFDKQIEALRNRYQIYEDLYGHSDKKSIKAKRTIAMIYLKREKYPECINELEDVLEIEEKIYGENSVQVGKTMKVLGTVNLSVKNMTEADQYLKKAQKILHEQGYPKLVKEIKSKMAILKDAKEDKK